MLNLWQQGPAAFLHVFNVFKFSCMLALHLTGLKSVAEQGVNAETVCCSITPQALRKSELKEIGDKAKLSCRLKQKTWEQLA